MAVKYHMQNKYQLLVFFFLLILTAFSLFLAISISSPKNKTVLQSRAASPGNSVNITAGTGATEIQAAVNAAKDGDTINIPAGSYSGSTAVPLGLGDAIFVSAGRGASDTCFIRIEGKSITLKGQNMGSIIYGEGHSDKANVMPYQTRAGICVVNGAKVTFDGIRIKEFQKRCIVVYNSTIIVKNSQIEGCDEGGASLLGDSFGLFVNNNLYSFNFGGIMLWQNSQAEIVNNTFYDAAVLYFYHPGTNDQARANIVNNIFGEIKSDIAQVSWWQATPEQFKMNKLSHNIIYRSKDFVCDPKFELWCDNFPGKIVADPMFTAPVIFMGGAEAWSDMTLKPESPALNAGDPIIPGPQNMGITGGPCVDPNSLICSSFIQSNMPKVIEPPTPTPVPQQEIGKATPTPVPQREVKQPPIPTQQPQEKYTTPEVGPFPSSIYNNVFTQEQEILYIENIGNNKTLRIISLYLQNTPQKIDKELTSLQSLKYSFAPLCKGQELKVKGALLYSSSEDNHQKIRYKNLDLDCYKTVIINIE